MFRGLLFITFTVLLACSNRQNQVNDTHLGELNIQVTAKQEAKPAFQEAMLLLHSFEYEDAADKFREAQALDPEFAMAYWGEAMCENHPLWREQNLNNAKAILEKLGATPEERRSKFKTEFEKDLFDAANILYGKGSKRDRDIAYKDKMHELHEKYPGNHEINAFYALSLLGSVKEGRDYEVYAQGAKIAKSILNENPNHPGALHYLIHSYDDPDNAHKALEAANSYSQVAPDAGHALHMPSHIYVALGMWDEVIKSNQASWKASVDRKNNKELDNDALNYHALKWLMYGYLQKGDFDSARTLLNDMQNYCYTLSSMNSVSHLIMMKAPYIIETSSYQEELIHDTIDYKQYGFYNYAVDRFLMGYTAFELKDRLSLTQNIDSLNQHINNHVNAAITGSAPLCSGAYANDAPSQLKIDRAKVMLHELEACLAWHDNNIAVAESKFLQATELKQSTSYNYGPPEIVLPSNELFGQFLLTQNRYAEARTQFEKVLERAPGRRIPTQQLKSIKDII